MSNETDLARREADAPVQREQPARGAALVPAVDIVEDKGGVTVWADLPGVPKDKLEVKVQDGHLSIEAEAVIPTPSGLNVTHMEVRAPRYMRAFSISSDLDTSKVDASLQDGVLTLRIPRREAALPRRIEVKAG
jgi:HSP20 family molecular chaperone IbpA